MNDNNDNNNNNEKVVDLFKGRRNGVPQPPAGFIPPQGLSQDTYRFYLINKETGELEPHERRGHLVITGTNIVLFNKDQEMIWGIPNDDYLSWFERVDKEDNNSVEEEASDLPF